MDGVRRWTRRIAIGIYAVITGLVGVGGRPIVDRGDLYGDDPANHPYGMDFDPDRPVHRGHPR